MSTYCQGCWMELFRLFLGPSPHHHSSSPAVALGSGDKINQTVEIRFRTDNNHNASDKDPGRFIPKHSLSDLHSHLDDIFWSRTTRAGDMPTTETLTPSPCGRLLLSSDPERLSPRGPPPRRALPLIIFPSR